MTAYLERILQAYDDSNFNWENEAIQEVETLSNYCRLLIDAHEFGNFLDPDINRLLLDFHDALQLRGEDGEIRHQLTKIVSTYEPKFEGLRMKDYHDHVLVFQESQDIEAFLSVSFSDKEIERGFLSELIAIFDKDFCSDTVFEILRRGRERVLEARNNHESRYLAISEWTVEVAVGDQLLQDGLNLWLSGLDILSEALLVKSERNAFAQINLGLDEIAEGNYNLLLLERLTIWNQSRSEHELAD